VDGTNLNLKMVEAGLAEMGVDTLDCLPVKLKYALAEAQQSARQHKLGIWGLTNYQSPSEYRLHRPGWEARCEIGLIPAV
jgi:endonuclease YncB( thermonuclease family)